jgi:hypothetical protein
LLQYIANISTSLCAKWQGLPLGRKLSQFFGRVVLIMTSPTLGPGKLKFSQEIFLLAIFYCPKVGKFKLRHMPPWGLSQGMVKHIFYFLPQGKFMKDNPYPLFGIF